MDLTAIRELTDGPKRTAALVAWTQRLHPEGLEPVLVGGAAVQRARLGVTQQAVAQAERWQSNPSVDSLSRWAAATGATLVLELEPQVCDVQRR